MSASSMCWYALFVAATLPNLSKSLCGKQWVLAAALYLDLLVAVAAWQGDFTLAVLLCRVKRSL